jgi:hypothetical protein
LIDFIPLLQMLPNPMKSRGKNLHQGLVDTYGGMIKDINSRMNSGEVVNDCLAKTMITLKDSEALDDIDMAILASAFMIGGVETVGLLSSVCCVFLNMVQTAAIMQWFSALIPAYPDAQRKAQKELDSIVGRGRLPTVEDEKNLPYCHAIVKEVSLCLSSFLN